MVVTFLYARSTETIYGKLRVCTILILYVTKSEFSVRNFIEYTQA